MYGSGLNEDLIHDKPTGTLSGEGSHLGNSRAAGEETPVTSTEPTAAGSDSTTRGSHSAVNEKPFSTHGLGTTYLNDPSSTHSKSSTLDDTATTASIKSGVPGNHQTEPTSTGSDSTTRGYHSGVNEKPFSTHGLGTTNLNDPSSTHSKSSRLDDTATTASIKSGVPGNPQSSSLTGSTANKDALELNKPLPQEPTGAGLSGAAGKYAAGPHSSNLANRADPRVDSDLDGSKGLGGGATGAGSELAGSSLPDRSIKR